MLEKIAKSRIYMHVYKVIMTLINLFKKKTGLICSPGVQSFMTHEICRLSISSEIHILKNTFPYAFNILNVVNRKKRIHVRQWKSPVKYAV